MRLLPAQRTINHARRNAVAAGAVDWGQYALAVRRWEQILERNAPVPTQLGRKGRRVLAPRFVEHLMGLADGWVTGVDIPRTAQLRVLGNGVVPQQASYALGLLLADFRQLVCGDGGIAGLKVAA